MRLLLAPLISSVVMFNGGLPAKAKNNAAVGAESRAQTTALKAIHSRLLTLSFPKRSVGGLYLTHLSDDGNLSQTKEVAVARDVVKIKVPIHQSLMFKPNAAFMQAPQILDAIQPDAIDIIQISYAPLDEFEDKSGDGVLKYIARQTGLKQLFLEQFLATDQGLASLSNLKQLKFLKSQVGSANGSCLKSLSALPELVDLDLSFNLILPDNFKFLAKSPKLRRLILHHCKIDELAMANIAKCTTIDDLSLCQNQLVRDSSIKSILHLKLLRTLDLRETGVTVEGIKQLKDLTRLKYLNVSATSIPPAQLAAIRKLMPQTVITVEPGGHRVDDDTRQIFAPLSKGRI